MDAFLQKMDKRLVDLEKQVGGFSKRLAAIEKHLADSAEAKAARQTQKQQQIQIEAINKYVADTMKQAQEQGKQMEKAMLLEARLVQVEALARAAMGGRG